MSAAAPELSVVVPVYGCEECLQHLHQRLTATLRTITSDYELVFIEDRGPDNSWQELRRLAAQDPHVRAFRLSRNFGQHAAITAGLAQSRGRWVVVMDCDLQEPPEEIANLYAKAQEGYDIVFAERRDRQHSWSRRTATRLYFRMLNLALGTRMSSELGNLSIISRKVADAFLEIPDQDRHYLMILHWLGFRHATIQFSHAERFAGESSYTLGSLVRFAFDGLFFQTTTLLRWIVYAGFFVSLLGVVLAGFYTYKYFITGYQYPGWTSLAVLLLLLSGFLIVTTGVTGLYIGKIFNQVKNRPLFVLDEIVDGSVTVPGSATDAGSRSAIASETEATRTAVAQGRSTPE